MKRREGNLQRENDHLLSHLNLNRTNVHLRSLRRWLKGKLPVYYHTSVKRIASISRRPLIWISNAVCSRVNIFFALLGQFYKTLSWKMMMIQKGVQSCAFVMSSKSHHTTAPPTFISCQHFANHWQEQNGRLSSTTVLFFSFQKETSAACSFLRCGSYGWNYRSENPFYTSIKSHSILAGQVCKKKFAKHQKSWVANKNRIPKKDWRLKKALSQWEGKWWTLAKEVNDIWLMLI